MTQFKKMNSFTQIFPQNINNAKQLGRINDNSVSLLAVNFFKNEVNIARILQEALFTSQLDNQT